MPAARARDDAPAKPRSDAYTGLLIVSLVALLAGAVFLYLDYSQYPSGGAPKVSAPATTSAPAPGAPPGPAAPGAPGAK
jgi:hypothetical protein